MKMMRSIDFTLTCAACVKDIETLMKRPIGYLLDIAQLLRNLYTAGVVLSRNRSNISYGQTYSL